MTSGEEANNAIAAGAVWAALEAVLQMPGLAWSRPAIYSPNPGRINQVDVRFVFMSSTYRVTVERLPDSEGDTGE